MTASEELRASIGRRLQKNRWLEWLIPAALCALMLGQLVLISRQLSQTSDEATHIYSGLRYLECGDLSVSQEHPPFAKAIASIPLLVTNIRVNCALPQGGDDVQQAVSGLGWFYSQNWSAALFRARLAISIFPVALCLLVWITARRMFGVTTAMLAGLLLIFEPNILAWGSLVMTDVPVTCMLLFAVLGFYLWVRHRSAPFLLLTALAAGLTLSAKHSGVVVVPILGTLAVADAFTQTASEWPRWQRALRNLLAFTLICVLAAGIVWAGYGMRFTAYPAGAQFHQAEPNAKSSSAGVLLAMERYHLLPEAYLEGFAGALSISGQSGPAFVAGKIYTQAPWFSTPFNLLIRNTTAMPALFLTAVFGLVIGFGQRRREVLFLLAPSAIFLAVCLRSTTNVSVRYLLPMFPFLLIVVAAGCVELARRVRWARYVVPCLVLLHAASSLHAFPNYLSYANGFWGGPTQAYRYLPWLDIGQSYRQVKDYTDRHPGRPCWLLTDWYWVPGLYGVPCTTIGYSSANRIPPRLTGTVIVSSTMLNGIRYTQGRAVAPFLHENPKDFIGGSALLVYEGDFDTRAAASMSAWRHVALVPESLDAELQEADEAVTLDPGSAPAHTLRCVLLSQAGIPGAAISECETAIRLATADPLHKEELSKLVEQAEYALRYVRPPTN